MKGNRCVVILSGGRPPFDIRDDDITICADSGATSLVSAGGSPDIVIGDMDSIDTAVLAELEKRGVTIEVHQRDKDLSDGELAVMNAISRHPKQIEIYGGKRGRSDHILASFHLLYCIPEGILATLHLEGDEVLLIRDGSEFKGTTDKPVISVLPASKRAKVTMDGVKWELKERVIEVGSTLGIHNEPRSGKIRIEAVEGDIYLIFANDPDLS